MKKFIIVMTSIALSFGIVNSTFAKNHKSRSNNRGPVSTTVRAAEDTADAAVKGTGNIVRSVFR